MGQVILESYYLLSFYPLALLVLLILCPKYRLNVFAIFLQNHVHPHIHIQTCMCGCTWLCWSSTKMLLDIHIYCCLIYTYIREYTLSYESIYLHYFSLFHIILPCGFKVTLLSLLFSLSFCRPLRPSQGRSRGDNLTFIVWKILKNKIRQLKNNLLSFNSLNLIQFITNNQSYLQKKYQTALVMTPWILITHLLHSQNIFRMFPISIIKCPQDFQKFILSINTDH